MHFPWAGERGYYPLAVSYTGAAAVFTGHRTVYRGCGRAAGPYIEAAAALGRA
jgi:hypothetical protein